MKWCISILSHSSYSKIIIVWSIILNVNIAIIIYTWIIHQCILSEYLTLSLILVTAPWDSRSTKHSLLFCSAAPCRGVCPLYMQLEYFVTKWLSRGHNNYFYHCYSHRPLGLLQLHEIVRFPSIPYDSSQQPHEAL